MKKALLINTFLLSIFFAVCGTHKVMANENVVTINFSNYKDSIKAISLSENVSITKSAISVVARTNYGSSKPNMSKNGQLLVCQGNELNILGNNATITKVVFTFQQGRGTEESRMTTKTWYVNSASTANFILFNCDREMALTSMEVTYNASASIDNAETGTTDIPTVKPDDSFVGDNNVYNIMGQIVRYNNPSLEGLPKGIYIVNRKKVMVY